MKLAPSQWVALAGVVAAGIWYVAAERQQREAERQLDAMRRVQEKFDPVLVPGIEGPRPVSGLPTPIAPGVVSW